MTAIVEGPKIAALSCGKAVYLVVLLHGPDSDGEAIINHALNWAPTLPKAEFGNIAAYSLVFCVPVFILYTVSSRLFREGFVRGGGVKG